MTHTTKEAGIMENERLSEIVQYYRQNPTPPAGTEGQQAIHLHEHHHYAPPPPPPPPPGQPLADKLVVWVYVMVLAMIALTLCAAILAVIGVILVVVLVALALVVALFAFMIRQMNEGEALKTLARKSPEGRRGK